MFGEPKSTCECVAFGFFGLRFSVVFVGCYVLYCTQSVQGICFDVLESPDLSLFLILLLLLLLQLALTIVYIAAGVFAAGWIGKV